MRLAFILIFYIVLPFSVSAQIKTLGSAKPSETKEDSTVKYDSLSNGRFYRDIKTHAIKDITDGTILNGQEVFCAQNPDNYLYHKFKAGHYYKIFGGAKGENKIKLKDKETNEYIEIWYKDIYNPEANLVLVGRYEKLIQTCLNQELTLVSYNKNQVSEVFLDLPDNENGYAIWDFDTHKPRKDININTKWVCTDVVIDTETKPKLLGQSGSRIALIIENEKYGKCYFYADSYSPYNVSSTKQASMLGCKFMTKAQQQEQSLAASKAKKKQEQASKESREKYEKERKERLDKCIELYGETNGRLIANHEVAIGMTKELCRASWGNPQKINETITSTSKREQWVYNGNRYLYFVNGRLTTIQK